MQRTLEKVFFALIRFEINGTGIEDVKNLITSDLLLPLFKLSKRHDLAHLIGDALDKNGLLIDGTEAKKHFIHERYLAIFRYEQLQHEYSQICQVLENAKIPYIPLKGSVIRQYYPEPWMRTSCDIDILVNKKDSEFSQKVIREKLNYKEKNWETDHDISLFSPNGVHLELHYSLVEEELTQKVNSVLQNIWDNIVENKSFKKVMEDEMFYFYYISHMAKHFELGGCGVRSFLDIYLLQKQSCYSTEKSFELLKKGGLLKFAKAIEETSQVWFGNATQTSLSNEIKDYVLYADMYIDDENLAAVKQARQGGKFKYLLSRVFLSREQLVRRYPNLQKYKWLMPIYQVRRWGRLLIRETNYVLRKLKINISLKEDKKERVLRLLKNLGLVK